MRPGQAPVRQARWALAVLVVLSCGDAQQPPVGAEPSTQTVSPPSPTAAESCGETRHFDLDMQALLESGDLAPTSEEAALRFVDDELAAFTTNPQLAQALVEGELLLERVESGDPLTTGEVDGGGQGAVSAASHYRSFLVLRTALIEGRAVVEGSEDEGWVSYRTPAGAVSAGVVAVLVDGGGGEDRGWVVDTMSFGLPASECAAPAGR